MVLILFEEWKISKLRLKWCDCCYEWVTEWLSENIIWWKAFRIWLLITSHPEKCWKRCWYTVSIKQIAWPRGLLKLKCLSRFVLAFFLVAICVNLFGLISSSLFPFQTYSLIRTHQQTRTFIWIRFWLIDNTYIHTHSRTKRHWYRHKTYGF